MKFPMRAVAALVLAACTLAPALAQDKTALDSERDKVSYMVGMDVGRSLVEAGPDMDFPAFQRAVGNAFAGGEPLIAQDQVQPLAQALMQRIAARHGKTPQGKASQANGNPVDRVQVGYLIGSDVGRSLAPIKDELELPVFVQAVRTVATGGKPLLAAGEADALRTSFSQRLQAKFEARQAQLASKNEAEGKAFLATNKNVKGVFTTASGLQYMVLRQGAGPTPARSDRVRVNYAGKLLDGTEFESSYRNGQPVEFQLDQVIPGWTEGLSMMPVGGKYRFWIPSGLAYGTKGTPGGPIGPNATLVFDVELLGIDR